MRMFPAKLRVTILLLYIAMSLKVAVLEAAIFNVPGDFPTIQDAADAAASGGTILVGPGTYRETVTAFTKDLVLESAEGASQTFLRGPETGAPSNPWIWISGNSTLRGFTLSSDPASVVWTRVEGGGVSTLPGALIADNVFDGTGAGPRTRAALSFNDSAGRVVRNVFRGWEHVAGFQLGVVETVNSGLVVVENNLFVDNRSTGVALRANQTSSRVVNNNFLRNRRAVLIGLASSGATFRNNILAFNEVGLEVHPVLPATTWTHNLVWANGQDYVVFPDPTGTDGNLRADPGFTPLEDLLLVSGSAAIDAGTDLDAPLDDFFGRLRPVDGDGDFVAAWDIGAVEHERPVLAVPALGASGLAALAAVLAALGLATLALRRRGRPLRGGR